MREKVAEVQFNLRNARKSAQICLLSLRLVRIMRTGAYLSGKIANLVDPVLGKPSAYEPVDIQPLVRAALEAGIKQVVSIQHRRAFALADAPKKQRRPQRAAAPPRHRRRRGRFRWLSDRAISSEVKYELIKTTYQIG